MPDTYLQTCKVINKIFYPDVASVIISFVRDDKKHWAKGLYKQVLINVNELSDLTTIYPINSNHRHMSRIFNRLRYEEQIAHDILNRVEQYCKGCRQNVALWCFDTFWKTCRTCRVMQRRRRGKKKMVKDYDKFLVQIMDDTTKPVSIMFKYNGWKLDTLVDLINETVITSGLIDYNHTFHGYIYLFYIPITIVP